MKKYLVLLLLSLFCVDLFSQVNSKEKKTNKNEKEKKILDEEKQLSDQGVRIMGQRIDYYSAWTHRGAKPVPLYEIHFSAFAPSRWGNYPDTELSSYLLFFPVVPNIALKHKWFGREIILSSQHSFYYPSVILKGLRNSGFGSYIGEESHITNIFSFRNELILSRILNYDFKKCFFKVPDKVLSLRLGFDYSPSVDGLYFPLINNSFMHNRTNSYRTGDIQYFLGAELVGNMYKAVNYNLSADYYTTNPIDNFVMEAGLGLSWHKNTSFMISASCNFSYTNANIRNKFSVFPLLDFVFKIRHEKTLQRGLF